MHYLVLATDYDGTIAHDGIVDDTTIAALERLRRGARRLILVTGRELEHLRQIMPRLDLFDLIVVENGAVLYDPASHEEVLLGAPPPSRFVERLRELEVSPLSVGKVIVASWEPNEGKILTAIHDLNLDLQITFNKGAVMVLPGGVTKASGLTAALERMEVSPLNCVGVGDAENDLAFLDLCGMPVAVANALSSVKERVALVTAGVRGAGVGELVDRILKTDLAELDADGLRGRVALACDEAETEVLYAPQRENLLVTGQSGGGKSTLILGLMERLTAKGFQWCVLDPEGDYEATEGAVIEGNATVAPTPEHVIDVLRTTGKGVVVNMLAVPLAERPVFLAALLPALLTCRARIGRPHVVVVDEAHHMLSRDWDPGAASLPAELEGFVFVTTTPDQVSARVLACVNRLLVVGQEATRSVEAFCRTRGIAIPGGPPDPEMGGVLMFDPVEGPIRLLRAISGTGDRRRHRRKYAEGRLGEDTSFWFRGPEGKLNLRAHNLITFLDLSDGVDEETWEWHRRKHEYSEWMRTIVKDPDMASEVADIEKNVSDTQDARRRIRAVVERRYTAPG